MSDHHVHQAIKRARRQAVLETPRPHLLTWCVRQALHHLYGWTPYY